MERSRRRENDQHLPIYKTGATKSSTKAGRREQGVQGQEKQRGEARRRCAWLQQRPRGSSHSGVPDATSRNQPEICDSLGLLTSLPPERRGCLSVLHHRWTLLPGFLPLGCRHLGQSCAITISSQKVWNHLALSLTTNTGQMKDQEAQRGRGPSWKSHSQ